MQASELTMYELNLSPSSCPIDPSEENPVKLLYQIHREINDHSWKKLFVEGWNALKERNTPAVFTAFKVAGATTTLFTIGFTGASTMFGVFAFNEALSPSHRHYFGHFAEWTMEAFLTSIVFLKVLHEIKQLGVISQANLIFDRHIHDENETIEHRVLIYEEKLDYLTSLHHNSFFSLTSLPNPGSGITDMERGNDIINMDLALEPVYSLIRKELKLPLSTILKAGWEEVREENTAFSRMAMKTAMTGITVFLTANFVAYGFGIWGAGSKAIEDYHAGEIPVIGGHTLGWAAEVIAIADVLYHVIGEIKHIGTAKLTATVFKNHIKKINEEKKPWWKEKGNRLYHVMKRQITMIPHGYFFNKPSWLMFCAGS